MIQKNIKLLLLVILLAIPFTSRAGEYPHDPASIEAMIKNHKVSSAVLNIRVLMENTVRLSHDNMSKYEEDRAKIEKRLAKINRYFNLLDFILNGTSTGFKAVRTYHSVKDNLKNYKKLLSDYNKACLKKGDIKSNDLEIINNSTLMIEDIAKECEHIYKSAAQLVEYISTLKNCKTVDMLIILNEIQTSFDRIDDRVACGYRQLWSYMSVRLGFWNDTFFRSKTIKTICDEEIIRWYYEAKLSVQYFRQRRKRTFEPLGGRCIIGHYKKTI